MGAWVIFMAFFLAGTAATSTDPDPHAKLGATPTGTLFGATVTR